tara:strand:+ start:437598 stop:437879 length:282 start_codon:yes stop_codon:yes gene_type:complete
MNTRTKATASIILTAGFLSLTACSGSSNKHAGNIGSIRSNPSPAMHTLARRASDRANTHAYVIDTNIRAMNNDFDRVFHLNRPSRLHNTVKPY